MPSIRDYRCIRKRYKSHHDVEMQRNADRALTQQEERSLIKYTRTSPGGTIRFKPGFEAAATKMKIPVITARKR